MAKELSLLLGRQTGDDGTHSGLKTARRFQLDARCMRIRCRIVIDCPSPSTDLDDCSPSVWNRTRSCIVNDDIGDANDAMRKC